MTTPTTADLSAIDRGRISWAGARYDFWLDINSVPRKHRRALRGELRSNLADAAAVDGVSTALGNVGPLRVLASDVAHDGRLRSRWLAGWVAALSALAVIVVAFMILSLYYSEGVLDSGTTEPVRSSLFPFFGSQVSVDPSNGGIAWTLEPGPLPLVGAAVAFVLAARPWRGLRQQYGRDV